jgi:hypothetical protein
MWLHRTAADAVRFNGSDIALNLSKEARNFLVTAHKRSQQKVTKPLPA